MTKRRSDARARRATPPLFAEEPFTEWRDELVDLVASPHAHRIVSGEPSAPPWTARVHAGVDEAGLGPLLGPLAIGHSAFRVAPGRENLWHALRAACTRKVDDADERIAVADSKEVFTRDARGERRLERTALAFLAQRAPAKSCPADARGVLSALASDARSAGAEDGLFASDETAEPWCAHLDRGVPAHCTGEEIRVLAAALGERMARAEVESTSAGARLVHVRDLNASFASTENKSRTHWLATRPVLVHLWRAHAREGLELTVDRHGGRVYYAHLLAETFLAATIHVVSEKPESSEYVVMEPASCASEPTRTDPARAAPPASASASGERENASSAAAAAEELAPRRMRIRFAERAENRAFAVALASCLAKYARETCMSAFNAYFDSLQPGLRPTAGYTSDGWRWLSEAGPAIERSGLARRELVRER